MKKLILVTSILFVLIQCNKKEENQDKIVQEKVVLSTDSLKKYSEETKKFLVKNLSQKIQEGGVESALEFCNIEAIPLTKKMSEKFGVEIKRVTDKPRNSQNLSSKEELQFIDEYKKQILAGEKIKPIVTEIYYYEPLITNGLCLQCHGEKGKSISADIAKKIEKLYPEDLAFGYKENEVRGLIRVKIK